MRTEQEYKEYGTRMFWWGVVLGFLGLLLFEFLSFPFMFGFFLGLND